MREQSSSKITLFCPSGHRLRGGAELMGKRVVCPRCKSAFVFAPSPAQLRPKAAPSERDAPHSVTESRVLAILAEQVGIERSDGAPMDGGEKTPMVRRCHKCDRPISDADAVCPHCRTYQDELPTFMREL